jgi:hypothetical protein
MPGGQEILFKRLLGALAGRDVERSFDAFPGEPVDRRPRARASLMPTR